jgi:hypothetical protein
MIKTREILPVLRQALSSGYNRGILSEGNRFHGGTQITLAKTSLLRRHRLSIIWRQNFLQVKKLIAAMPAKTRRLWTSYICKTRADFVLDQSARLFTFSLSANHNAENEKFTPMRTRKYSRLLGLP